MALSDILEKIKKDSASKVEQLEKEFNEKKKKLEQNMDDRKKKIDEQMHQKVEENSKKIIEKAETLAEREAKNNLLKAKRQLIDETLDLAVEQLAKSDNYQEIIADMLKKADLEGENIVVIPARGKEEETKKAIKDSGKDYFLSDKSQAIKGGFILKTDKVEIDNSFETIIKEQLKEDLEIKLHKMLF